MNVFYENLPGSLTINGKEYSIITDFREWIRFSDMLKADIPASVKVEFLSEMFLADVPDIYTEEGFNNTIDSIMDFLTMKELEFPTESENGTGSQVRSIYYDYDAPYIISAFLREYNIDLLSISHLHWWKFRMLLDGLDEHSLIKERIYYRTVDIRDIKDKEEKKRILRIRRLITIPDEDDIGDGDIGNAFI